MRIEPESVIATGTVVLRPWCAGDVEALTAIYSDPLSAQYIEVPQPYDAAQATEFVRRSIRSRAAGTTFHYAVTLPGADTVVGSAYLHDRAPSEAATHVSYVIHPNHRGRGLATAALIGLSEAALSAGFLQVLARTKTGHRASETVAARAGFSVLWSNDEESCWHKTATNAST